MKRLIQKGLGLFGNEIRSVYTPLRKFDAALKALAKEIEVSTVIDVGVAEGTPELYEAFNRPTLLIEANPDYQFDWAGKRGFSVEKVFCGAKKGKATFYKNGRKSSLIPPGEKIEVPIVPLDGLIKKRPAPFLLKIDVEGAEMGVLRGAEDTLKRTSAVVVETKLTHFDEVIPFLTRRGFELVDMSGGAVVNGTLTQVDLIFSRPKVQSKYRQ